MFPVPFGAGERSFTGAGQVHYIADATTEPWPGVGGNQPDPDARVEEHRLLTWFGPEGAPVLQLPRSTCRVL